MFIKNKPYIKKVSDFELKSSCMVNIALLNTKNKVHDIELKSLKVDGRDEVSKISKKELKNKISPEELSIIKERISYHLDIQNVIRWRLRGLRLDLAIRKVEISKEIRGYYSRKRTFFG